VKTKALAPPSRRIAHVDTIIGGVPDWAIGFAAGALLVGLVTFFRSSPKV
jgi:hypothetical protein